MIYISRKRLISWTLTIFMTLTILIAGPATAFGDDDKFSNEDYILEVWSADDAEDKLEEEFGKIYDLPSLKWKIEAAKIAKRFEKAITVTDEGPRADFNKITNMILQSDDLAIIGISDESVQRNDASVDAMLEEVKKLLILTLDISGSNNIVELLKAAIQNAFTNIAYDKESVAGLWTKEEGKQLTYKYNVFYAVKNAHTGEMLAIVPMSITIKVDVKKETVGWGLLTLTDRNNYVCRIQSLEVVQIPQ